MTHLLVLLLLLFSVGPFAGTTGRPKSPPCVTGSCSDNFAGPSGQPLATHNTAWVTVNATAPVTNLVLSGTGYVSLVNFNAIGGGLQSSTASDIGQIVLAPTGGAAYSMRRICVRATANVSSGYCVYLCGGVGTATNDSACIGRSGTMVQQGAIVNFPTNVAHTLRVVYAAGVVTGYVDGTQRVQYTDASPLAAGHPAILAQGDSVAVTDSYMTNFQDF